MRYHTQDTDLFVPAIVIYMLGIVFFQCIIEGSYLLFFTIHAWMDGVNSDATNLVFRHGDLILVMNVFGLNEDRKVVVRDLGVAACRFLAEDIPQTIIQILFLMEDRKNNENKGLVMVSIGIAMTLSSIKFVGAAWKCYKSPDIYTTDYSS